MTDVVAGRFALVDPIGAGGSGTVWRAFDRKRGGYCAAKLLRQRDAGELLRFVREQSVRLAHPHIVSPYSWAAEDGTVLIASDLVAGGSLHTLVGDYGPLAEGTVVAVLRQVLAGLGAVHDAELIHRDVKPGNVLLHATGTGPVHLVLTDFGLTISKRDARLTQVGTVIGTPGYLPPEVLVGGVPPDPRHDLYAAGRLTLTLLAGDEPDGHGTLLIESIRDPALRATVDALLRRDPTERPQDVAAAVALLAAAHGDPMPRASDGEWIDLADQLPPLPEHWGAAGPESRLPTAGRSSATVVDVLPTAPMPARPLGPAAPAPVGTGGGSAISAPPSSAGPESGAISGTPPRRRRSGRATIVGTVAGVAVVVVGMVLGLRLLGTAPDDPDNRTTVRPSVGVTATSVTGSSTSTNAPATSSAPSPTSTLGPTTENLRAGDPCGWQLEGDRRTGVDGMLVCTLVDGAYQWRSPG